MTDFVNNIRLFFTQDFMLQSAMQSFYFNVWSTCFYVQLRGFLEKLKVAQWPKCRSSFMEPEGSLLYSQELATGPSPEPDKSQSTRSILSSHEA
jgi:hypothetical protein